LTHIRWQRVDEIWTQAQQPVDLGAIARPQIISQ
jgi:hypothetical protein